MGSQRKVTISCPRSCHAFWDRCNFYASSRSANMLVHGYPVLPLPVTGATVVCAGSQYSLSKETMHEGVVYHWWNPRWPDSSSHCVLVCSEKNLECFRGKETSVSDEKIRKMGKVPPVFVLVMARTLPPALFALSADCAIPCRRSWEHCHPQLLNLKLGNACGKSWKQLLRAFVKKMARGTLGCVCCCL